MDLNKTDMLQLLSYLESELQARDVAIAQLKVKSIICVDILLKFASKVLFT